MSPSSNVAVTVEQIARLERALLSLRELSDADPEVIDAIAANHYEHIMDLRAELDGALGFSEPGADLVLAFGGEGIVFGQAPSRIVLSTLDAFSSVVQKIASFVANGDLPGKGRPSTELVHMTDFQLVGVKPGSVQVMLNLPEPETLFPEFDSEPVRRAVDLVVQTASWTSSKSDLGTLAKLTDDDRLKRLLLSQLQRIAPSPKGALEYVGLAGNLVKADREVLLTRESKKQLDIAFSALQADRSATVAEKGRLRQVDMDSEVFQLRDRPDELPSLSCRIPHELLALALGYLVEDVSVLVEGIQNFDRHGRPTTLDVTQINPFEL